MPRNTGNVSSSAKSVATTATLLVAANANGNSAIIANGGTAPVYIGGAGVTTATGLPIAAGATLTLPVLTSALYGIVATGTVGVRVLLSVEG